jgi:putative lipoic acid-binding regulatory protein
MSGHRCRAVNHLKSPWMEQSLPIVDLLENTHAFPGPYLFKVIGKADHGFLARVVGVVRKELGSDVDPPYHVREAVGGRHVAVTFELVAQSAQQVVAIYRQLGLVDGVVMLF